MDNDAPGDRAAPDGWVWVHVPPPRPPISRRSHRRLILASAVWGLVLLVVGIVYAFHGAPTVRGQTTIASSQATVDTAIARVVAAAGPAPIVALGGFAQIQTCSVTLARQGAQYQRTVDLYAAPGTESAILHTIAAGLPESYRAETGPDSALHLDADAGDYVGIVGSAPFPGDVQVRAETGCRPLGTVAAAPAAPSIDAAEMAPVRAVLAALGITPTSPTAPYPTATAPTASAAPPAVSPSFVSPSAASPPAVPPSAVPPSAVSPSAVPASTTTSAAEVTCASGHGMLRTVAGHIPPLAEPVKLGTQLAALTTQPGNAAHPIVADDDLVAYRSGTTDVVVSQNQAGITVSATTGCR